MAGKVAAQVKRSQVQPVDSNFKESAKSEAWLKENQAARKSTPAEKKADKSGADYHALLGRFPLQNAESLNKSSVSQTPDKKALGSKADHRKVSHREPGVSSESETPASSSDARVEKVDNKRSKKFAASKNLTASQLPATGASQSALSADEGQCQKQVGGTNSQPAGETESLPRVMDTVSIDPLLPSSAADVPKENGLKTCVSTAGQEIPTKGVKTSAKKPGRKKERDPWKDPGSKVPTEPHRSRGKVSEGRISQAGGSVEQPVNQTVQEEEKDAKVKDVLATAATFADKEAAIPALEAESDSGKRKSGLKSKRERRPVVEAARRSSENKLSSWNAKNGKVAEGVQLTPESKEPGRSLKEAVGGPATLKRKDGVQSRGGNEALERQEGTQEDVAAGHSKADVTPEVAPAEKKVEGQPNEAQDEEGWMKVKKVRVNLNPGFVQPLSA
jgi:hypothetical protein